MPLEHKRLKSEELGRRNENYLPFGRISQRVRRGGCDSDLEQYGTKRQHCVEENGQNQHSLHGMSPFQSSPTKGIFNFNASRPMYGNVTDSQLGLIASDTVIRNDSIALTQARFNRDDLPHPNKLRSEHQQDSSYSVSSSLSSPVNSPFELLTATEIKMSESVCSKEVKSFWRTPSCEPCLSITQCRAVRTNPLKPRLIPENKTSGGSFCHSNSISHKASSKVTSASSVWSSQFHHQKPTNPYPSAFADIMTSYSLSSSRSNNIQDFPSSQAMHGDMFSLNQQTKMIADQSTPNSSIDSPTLTYPRRRSEE